MSSFYIPKLTIASVVLQILVVKTVAVVYVKAWTMRCIVRVIRLFRRHFRVHFSVGALLPTKLQNGCWLFGSRMIRIVGCVFSEEKNVDTFSLL